MLRKAEKRLDFYPIKNDKENTIKLKRRNITMLRKNNILLLAISFIILLTGLAKAQDLPELFTEPTIHESNSRQRTDVLPDRLTVNMDFSLIKPAGNMRTAFRASLPDRKIVLQKSWTETREEGNYTWAGKIEGDKLSSAVITVVNRSAFGSISTNGETYAIEPDGKGAYVVIKQDPAKIMPIDEGGIESLTHIDHKKYHGNSRVPSKQEDGSRIDVLVLYTQMFSDAYVDTVNAKIQHLVDLANAAYANSGIYTRLRLVASVLFTDTAVSEQNGMQNTIAYMRNEYVKPTHTGIAALREQYKADLVSLVRVFNERDLSDFVCGVGYMGYVGYPMNHDGDSAFSVVDVGSVNGTSCSDDAFAHEIGHNLGCVHDRAHTKGSGAYPYAYGYGIPGKFGDIMSYIYPHIPYFSTPDITYQDMPIGIPPDHEDSADNVKSINNMAVFAANYMVADDANCSFSFSPEKFKMDSKSGSGSFTVTVSGGENCKWTAETTRPWLTITSDNKNITSASSGIVTFSWTSYPVGTWERYGAISVAGNAIEVVQSPSLLIESCTATVNTVNNEFYVKVPSIEVEGDYWEVELKNTPSDGNNLMFTATLVEHYWNPLAHWEPCRHTTFVIENNSYVLHIHSLLIGNSFYWADFQYITGTSSFKLINAGAK